MPDLAPVPQQVIRLIMHRKNEVYLVDCVIKYSPTENRIENINFYPIEKGLVKSCLELESKKYNECVEVFLELLVKFLDDEELFKLFMQ